MPDFCCHIYGQDDEGQPTELFHTHVNCPMVELVYPAVMVAAARANVDLRTATAVSMDYLMPLDAKEREEYETFRASQHPGPAQAAPASPAPDTPLH